MQLGQVISNPDLEGDYSPIYTTEKKRVRTRKKVGTDQIFFPCKPSVLCFPKWIRTRLFWFWGYGRLWPQNRKKKNESGSLLLFESAVQTHLRSVPSSLCEPAVVYGGFAHVYYCTFQS